MDTILQVISIIFWFIVILIPLVAIHEFGHLLIARLFGVKVLEYGIGIPPRVKGWKWKGILWSLNWVPLGGFARIYGDNDAIDEAQDVAKKDYDRAKKEYIENRLVELLVQKDLHLFLEDNSIEFTEQWATYEKQGGDPTPGEEDDFKKLTKQVNTLIEWEFDTKLKSKDTFFSKNLVQQILILLGGILFNLGTAFVLFTLMSGFGQNPPVNLTRNEIQEGESSLVYKEIGEDISVGRVRPDGAAFNAGLRDRDLLLKFGSFNVDELNTQDDFIAFVKENRGQELDISYRSNETGLVENSTITIPDEEDPKIGVERFGYPVVANTKGVWNSVRAGWNQTWFIFELNYNAIRDIVTIPFSGNTEALETVGGPIQVGYVGGQIFNLNGAGGIILVMAAVSVSLAFFNLLPIPALDGGRIVIAILNKITGGRNRRLEATVIGISFVILLGLMVLVAFRDVWFIVNDVT